MGVKQTMGCHDILTCLLRVKTVEDWFLSLFGHVISQQFFFSHKWSECWINPLNTQDSQVCTVCS